MRGETFCKLAVPLCRLLLAFFYPVLGYFVILVWCAKGAGWGIASAVCFPVTMVVVPIWAAMRGNYLPLGLFGGCWAAYKIVQGIHMALRRAIVGGPFTPGLHQ